MIMVESMGYKNSSTNTMHAIKEKSVKFSLIVLMYNSEWSKVAITIKSIMQQDFKDYEIIYADDGSQLDCYDAIVEYMEKCNFTEYYLAPRDKNVGTVCNIGRALQMAKGKYLKCIGAGDYLIDETVLTQVYNIMSENRCKWLFGEMSAYAIVNGKSENRYFCAPYDMRPYKNVNMRKIKNNIVVFQDHISGAAMFFEREYFQKYLYRIKDIVVYVEDLIQVLVMLDEGKVFYLDKKLIGYEVGEGITTSNCVNKKIVKDFENFDRYLKSKYGSNILVRKRFEVNKMKKEKRLLKKYSNLFFVSPSFFIIKRYKQLRRIKHKEYLGFLDNVNFYREFISVEGQ